MNRDSFHTVSDLDLLLWPPLHRPHFTLASILKELVIYNISSKNSYKDTYCSIKMCNSILILTLYTTLTPLILYRIYSFIKQTVPIIWSPLIQSYGCIDESSFIQVFNFQFFHSLQYEFNFTVPYFHLAQF